MSDPRRYYNPASNSGSNQQTYSSGGYVNSLTGAGMSSTSWNYPAASHQGNSSADYYSGAGQAYPPTSSGQTALSQQGYQQAGYAAQANSGYRYATAPMSPDSPLNYNSNSPNTPYNGNSRWPAMSNTQYPSNPPHMQPSSQWASAQQASVQPFSPESWNDMLMSSMASPTSPTPVSPPYGSSANYPYTSASASGIPAYPSSQVQPTSSSSRGVGGSEHVFGVKQCYHCRATTTPLWRRDPVTHNTLCNACGLYLQQRHALRPKELIEADNDDDDMGSEASEGAPDGPECSHCHTRQTSVWRRNKAGDQVCNACGVYARLRGKDRPLSLKRNKIKPRAKHPQS
ncbi:hypothetical protein B0H10DRAFT_2217995 [Mycena sp. CBHHK59/15]|nr:hypothetical protein B0H10DRAFT_1958470 [Mycena sp. CBHHK59/15]KAJ6618030.1 hypothetical protein B0H10DRAFT_2217995 [Mycena sp. CBHHK59/15]